MDIVDRVKAILLTPKSEWLVIERESGDPTYLFTNYVAILAAIPAVCGFVGTSIIGRAAIGTVRVGIVSGIAFAVVNYLLAFVMVYVMGVREATPFPAATYKYVRERRGIEPTEVWLTRLVHPRRRQRHLPELR
jgi:hypothetical protein